MPTEANRVNEPVALEGIPDAADALSGDPVLVPVRRLYGRLLRDANAQKRRNLATLWLALSQMRLAGETNYSVAQVSKRLSILGGVTRQTIQNSSGAYFKQLILAWATAVGGTVRRTSPLPDDIEAIVSQIGDARSRNILRQEWSRLRQIEQMWLGMQEPARKEL